MTTGSGVLAPPAARAVGATKIYGQGDAEVRAIDGIDVQFTTGAFTAIMGPSGSGKSTLMQCMAGLDRLTSGETWIGDVELTGLSEKQLTIGPPRPGGLHLPVLQPGPDPHGAREHPAAPDIAGRDPEWRLDGRDHRCAQPARAPEAPALRALGRAAAARRRRPGAGVAARTSSSRTSRPGSSTRSRRRSCSRFMRRAARRVRPDHRHGHARAGRGQPADLCCSSATGGSWARWTEPTPETILDRMKTIGAGPRT